MTVGGILGGVYAYLDNNDNMVVIDGNNHLLRIGKYQDRCGSGPVQKKKTCYFLRANQDTPLGNLPGTISGKSLQTYQTLSAFLTLIECMGR